MLSYSDIDDIAILPVTVLIYSDIDEYDQHGDSLNAPYSDIDEYEHIDEHSCGSIWLILMILMNSSMV